MIEDILSELKEKWNFTDDQIDDIRREMVSYALCAIMDSTIREEAFELAE